MKQIFLYPPYSCVSVFRNVYMYLINYEYIILLPIYVSYELLTKLKVVSDHNEPDGSNPINTPDREMSKIQRMKY